ncbi:hypothetical protein DTO027B9_6137 [Paecilomyces variotii]|nr:hypothetical protein DTO027B9_6137 [Paecilomyces variotii]KAJ9406630.1 hypothetical protein DTO045G8_5578 [Paecilomyces variotii]
MASPLRPQFFISRPNGTMTPMIAVDELPAHISIRGVPRVLAPSETQGMTSLGSIPPRAQFYVVEGVPLINPRVPTPGPPNQFLQDVNLQTSIMRVASDENLTPSQRLALQTMLQQNLPQNWIVPSPAVGPWGPANTAGHGGARSNSGRRDGNVTHNPKKEFCSYWIRHGECDYQQQGCLYKHEMPKDLPTLEKLGLRDIPRWYREKHGIPSLLPNGHHGRHQVTSAQDRGLNSTTRTLPYHLRLGITAGDDIPGPDNQSRHKTVNQPSIPQAPAAMRAQNHTGRETPYMGDGIHSQKHAPKNIPGMHDPSTKKIDLLSFDPLPGYPTLDPIRRNSSDGEKSSSEDAELVHHHEFVRSMQSLMSGPGGSHAPTAIHANFGSPTQMRSKKPVKSRRLYQPRVPAEAPAKNQVIVETPSFRGKNNGGGNARISRAASPDSKSSSQSTTYLSLSGPGHRVSSASSSRVGSPSTDSPSCHSDSLTSANPLGAIGEGKKNNHNIAHSMSPLPKPNYKKGKGKAPMDPLADDLFGLGLEDDDDE